MIDSDGFRIGVGIIVSNAVGELLWARRLKQFAWQFPQGGVNEEEEPEEALYRELYEELGLTIRDVKKLGETKNWLYYKVPEYLRRRFHTPMCIGQRQKWYLLQLIGDPDKICFNSTCFPEFDKWRWVSYWYPLRCAVTFKRHVYRRALEELSSFLPAFSNK